MSDQILNKCHENLAIGVDTIDLVIDRDKPESQYLAPGYQGPKGEVLVPYVKNGVQRGWVVNFNIREVLEYINGDV